MERDNLESLGRGTSMVVFGNELTALAWDMRWLFLTAFCLMGVDKRRAKLRAAGASAKKVRRIPEATLLLWAGCFGGVGATLGMFVFRHKTRHWYFRIGLPVMAAVQVLLLTLHRWLEPFKVLIACFAR